MRNIRIALAQINMIVGDLEYNAGKIKEYTEKARDAAAEIVAFPELALTGYPPEDLLLKPQFMKDVSKIFETLVPASKGIISIVGLPWMDNDLYNAAAVLYDGKLIDVYHKMYLPNYSVFDEFRYFKAGEMIPVYNTGEFTFGVNICEDLWLAEGPTLAQALEPGCSFIVNISSSPYYFEKGMLREKVVGVRAYDNQVYVAYVNTVGGQDELVFDGQSLVGSPDGSITARGARFTEDLLIVDLDLSFVANKHLFDPKRRQRARSENLKPVTNVRIDDYTYHADRIAGSKSYGSAMAAIEADTSAVTLGKQATAKETNANNMQVEPSPDPMAEIYEALELGISDYVRKNGFEKVVIGLSGGIDSALTAAICVDALGSQNVIGVAMPSRYSSEGSISDAELLADNLGIKLLYVPIEPVFEATTSALASEFRDLKEDTTEENIQPRIRGMVLMALSNKFGWLVIATGNKSELAVGYTTLYGDMVGGFAILKDVYKTTVYQLARYRNSLANEPVIPLSTISKPPSAELKPGQKDSDTLPAYPVLDRILYGYIEQEKSLEDLVSEGLPKESAAWVIRNVNRNEYKRRQGPVGIKIGSRAFGKDRRMPITHSYKEESLQDSES